MTDKDILKYGEIQYLKGRLDELLKSFDIMLDAHGSRKLDQRIEKYIQKFNHANIALVVFNLLASTMSIQQ